MTLDDHEQALQVAKFQAVLQEARRQVTVLRAALLTGETRPVMEEARCYPTSSTPSMFPLSCILRSCVPLLRSQWFLRLSYI